MLCLRIGFKFNGRVSIRSIIVVNAWFSGTVSEKEGVVSRGGG